MRYAAIPAIEAALLEQRDELRARVAELEQRVATLEPALSRQISATHHERCTVLQQEQRIAQLEAEREALRARVAELENFSRAILVRMGFDFSPPTPEEEAWARKVIDE